MIPGSNLLKSALKLIAKQKLVYYRYTGRTTSAKGQYVSVYAAPVFVKGSFQPVARSLYEQYGLDFTKSYFNFYAPEDIFGVEREVSGDQLSFNGKQYQCESTTEWYAIDGWIAVLCVNVPKTLS